MNLAERLLGPQFEAALEEHRFVKDPLLRTYAKAIRELHARLAAAKAEGAAEELAALVNDQTIHAESGSILVNSADLEPQAWINVRVIRERAAALRKQVQG